MSATLSGLVVLENARPVDGQPPLSVMFDGQMWLGPPQRILTGTFRYYNTSNYSFPEVGHYFAWIHVAKFVPEGEPETTERQPTEGQKKDEEVAGSEGDGSSSDAPTLDEPDIVHVVGDIVQLIPTVTEEVRQQTYINVCGAAMNINRPEDSFDINAGQYTSHYKNNRSLSILPVRAHFNLNKYRTTTPMPSDNSYVSVEGHLEGVKTDAAGHATLFHVLIDSISFLGRANHPSPSPIARLVPPTPSRPSRRFQHRYDTPSPTPHTQVSVPSTPSTSDSGLL